MYSFIHSLHIYNSSTRTNSHSVKVNLNIWQLWVIFYNDSLVGEICGGDYAAEYVCDIGTCCKVNGRWDCLTDEQDSYMCEK